MSGTHQNIYISVHEFVESWDKEIYELTNLDFFIYLMINHLGNQLENRFFVQAQHQSHLFLNFERTGTLCFNLGDSFEFFLEENCLGNVRMDESLRFDHSFQPKRDSGNRHQQRMNMLQALVSSELYQEQRFRIELMENVILDTVVQFYFEELGLELSEDDFEVIGVADFIEDIIVAYIRHEGQQLLRRYNDPAVVHFEELLQNQAEPEENFLDDWDAVDEDDALDGPSSPYEDEGIEEDWTPHYEDINETFQKFLNEHRRKPGEKNIPIEADIMLFQEYLTDYACINNSYEICEEHLLEFMSVWLIQKFSQTPPPDFAQMFKSLARFFKWLNKSYRIDLRQVYVAHYDRVKVELPRVLRVMNDYLKTYNILNVMMLRDHPDSHQINGFFEIINFAARGKKKLDLMNISLQNYIENVGYDIATLSRLKTGDILHATLIQNGDCWEILEIHYLYPKASRPFVL